MKKEKSSKVLEKIIERSVSERLDTFENLGTSRTSSNVNPSRISKRTSYTRKKNRYKPFLRQNYLLDILIIFFVSPTL